MSINIEVPAPVEIDFDEYVDGSVQALRIWEYAEGDPAKAAAFKGKLFDEQAAGRCTILFMDELIAIVQWLQGPHSVA